MSTRIIRVPECAQCPANSGASYCQEYYDGGGMRPTPPTGTPAWCPLEQASDTPSDTAAILLRTIAAEAERTGSWHVPPDLQERVRAWVAERDGGSRE